MNVPRELLERVWEVYMTIENGDTIPKQLWDTSYDEVWQALWGKGKEGAA